MDDKQKPVPDLDVRDLAQDPKAPKLIPGSSREERVAIVAHVLDDLKAHPLTRRNARTGKVLPEGSHTWSRIRALPVGRLKVQDVLGRPGVTGACLELDKVIRVLVDALDMRVDLLRRLEQVDAVAHALGLDCEHEHERLARVRGAA